MSTTLDWTRLNRDELVSGIIVMNDSINAFIHIIENETDPETLLKAISSKDFLMGCKKDMEKLLTSMRK